MWIKIPDTDIEYWHLPEHKKELPTTYIYHLRCLTSCGILTSAIYYDETGHTYFPEYPFRKFRYLTLKYIKSIHRLVNL